MSRQNAIDMIECLWPPDADHSETSDVGKQDLLDALCAEWRTQPTTILQRMARVQRARDNK